MLQTKCCQITRTHPDFAINKLFVKQIIECQIHASVKQFEHLIFLSNHLTARVVEQEHDKLAQQKTIGVQQRD